MNLFTNTILKQLIDLDFNFGQFSDKTKVEEIKIAILQFFYDNLDKLDEIEDECNVNGSGNQQHVIYKNFRSDGRIIDFSQHWHEKPDTKIYHSNFPYIDDDGNVKNMKLYYVMEKNEYNS